MEQKKSIVKEASYYTTNGVKQQDNFGNYSLKVVFENGDSGWFSTKYDTNSAFKIGHEVDYCIETKPKKSGGTFDKITLPKKGANVPVAEVPQSPTTPTPQVVAPSTERLMNSKSFTEMKFESRMNVIKLAVSAYIAGKIDYDQVKEHFETWVGMADAAIDDLKTK